MVPVRAGRYHPSSQSLVQEQKKSVTIYVYITLGTKVWTWSTLYHYIRRLNTLDSHFQSNCIYNYKYLEWSYPAFTILFYFSLVISNWMVFNIHLNNHESFLSKKICVKLKMYVWKCFDRRGEHVKIVIFTQIRSVKQTQMVDGTKFYKKIILEAFVQMITPLLICAPLQCFVSLIPQQLPPLLDWFPLAFVEHFMMYWMDIKGSKNTVDLCDTNTSMYQCCMKRNNTINMSYTVFGCRNIEKHSVYTNKLVLG